jgi:hypothetical protein
MNGLIMLHSDRRSSAYVSVYRVSSASALVRSAEAAATTQGLYHLGGGVCGWWPKLVERCAWPGPRRLAAGRGSGRSQARRIAGEAGKLRASAQLRVCLGDDCKIADDSLPRFESWTCHQNRRSGPAREPGPSACGSGVQHRRSRLRGPGPWPWRHPSRPMTSRDTGES